MRWTAILVLLLCTASSLAQADVKTVRVPDGGIEPQAVIDAAGVIHLIYYKGSDTKGDLFYTTTTDGEKFSPAVRVNSQAGSALSIGGVRGAQMALGRNGRVHVAWMGSASAEPKAVGKAVPMLYTRDNGDGKFEPQRNVIFEHTGLDGGGSIAADDAGNVYVAWHAPSKPGAGEADRRIWLARSADDGGHFDAETEIAGRGVCACCSMRIAAEPGGAVFGVFRQAVHNTHRGTMLFEKNLAFSGSDRETAIGGEREQKIAAGSGEREIAPMESATCLLSTFALAATPTTRLTAYETKGEVFLYSPSKPHFADSATASAGRGKYPALAVNAAGEILVARAVGTGWNKGGTIAWQVFTAAGKPIAKSAGQAPDLAAWSYPAAVAKVDGSFLIFY